MPEYLSPGVYVEEVPSAVQAIAGVSTSTAGFIGIVPDVLTILVPNPTFDPTAAAKGEKAPRKPAAAAGGEPPAPASTPAARSGDRTLETTFTVAVPAGTARLCTTFTEFRDAFGDFSTDPGHARLAHAVFGFFNNGGSRCFVTRVTAESDVRAALERFEAIDEIALVAAPGLTDAATRSEVLTHCERVGDRFAILDSEETVPAIDASMLPTSSKAGAFYFPWIAVFDPREKLERPAGPGTIFVPPSGHVAGVYARVDATRGVHKAPANEVVRGALGVRYAVTKALQQGLNPKGVNCIRDMNGNFRVWGARTIGGDGNGANKYVNVRRLLLFLCESIEEGTQWTVFEPNDAALWAKITRNVSAFLTTVWRDGALFGATPQEAFYVRCDRETNPPEQRELGRVTTEVGVAVVRPAEFVVFRISQWSGPEAK